MTRALLVQGLAEPPARWLDSSIDKSRRISITPSLQSPSESVEGLSACFLSSIVPPPASDAILRRQSQSQIVSQTSTRDTLDIDHTNYEDETHVPVFSGWVAFCGVHTPPILVPRTHWDDTIAGNKQARLEGITLANSIVATEGKGGACLCSCGGPPNLAE